MKTSQFRGFRRAHIFSTVLTFLLVCALCLESFYTVAFAGSMIMDYSVESQHPYQDNATSKWTISRSGASKIRVHFVYIETERNYDFVKTSSGNSWDGDVKDVWSNWSNSSSIEVALSADISVSRKGFVIDKVEADMPAGSTQTLFSKPITIESDHPYINNYIKTWNITQQGANKIRVHFSKIATEKGFDYVKTSGGDSFTGIYPSGDWSKWVQGDTISVILSSDAYITDYGFVIDKYEFESNGAGYCQPTSTPTVIPTVRPTNTPTLRPDSTPTVRPTSTPTVRPTSTPTVRPTSTPTVRPTSTPTVRPTSTPTPKATVVPNQNPNPYGTPVPNTVNVDNEPANNSMNGALLLGFDSDYKGRILNAANGSYVDTGDFFKFYVTPEYKGKLLNVTLRIPANTLGKAAKDFNLELYNSKGELLSVSKSISYAYEQILHVMKETGLYYVRVVPLNSNQKIDSYYTLKTSITTSYFPYGGEEYGWGYFSGRIMANTSISVKMDNSMFYNLDSTTTYATAFRKSMEIWNTANKKLIMRTFNEAYDVKSVSPYPASMNKTYTVSKSGATKIRVHFAKIGTEDQYDFVKTSAGDSFTGPLEDKWSKWINGNSINIILTSDAYVSGEGFVVDRIEYVNAASTENLFTEVSSTTATDRSKTIVVVAENIPESSYWAFYSYNNGQPVVTINTAKLNTSASVMAGLTNMEGINTIMSHELGHALGLKDLYAHSDDGIFINGSIIANENKLMYGIFGTSGNVNNMKVNKWSDGTMSYINVKDSIGVRYVQGWQYSDEESNYASIPQTYATSSTNYASASYVGISNDALNKDADIIVRGKIKKVSDNKELSNGIPMSTVTLDVEKVLKNNLGNTVNTKILQFLMDGNSDTQFEENILPQEGEEYIFFLKNSKNNKLFILGGPQGRFTISDSSDNSTVEDYVTKRKKDEFKKVYGLSEEKLSKNPKRKLKDFENKIKK